MPNTTILPREVSHRAHHRHLDNFRGLYEPKPYFTPDPERNRESIRRVAALGPELVAFGHGPPLRDPAKLAEFAAGLPA